MISSARLGRLAGRLAVASLCAAVVIAGWKVEARAASCLNEAFGGETSCVSEDIKIASISVSVITEACDGTPGDTFTFDGFLNIRSSAQRRYDLGFYIGASPQTSSNDDCAVVIIPPSSSDLDGDSCGDVETSASIAVPVAGLTAACQDSDADGFFDVNSCSAWDVNSDRICTGPDDAVPSSSPKCRCEVVPTDAPTPRCSTNPAYCEDDNACTDDVCHPLGSGLGDYFGCSHRNNSAPCDDGVFCNGADVCAGGICTHPGDPCTGGGACGDRCNETEDSCIEPAGTPCRLSAGVCDVEERCDGSSAACPSDRFAAAGLLCRAASGECNPAETCSGSSPVCPGDSFRPATTPCGDPSDTACDDPDTCDGSGSCRANNAADGVDCDDGAWCNGPDLCSSGACQHAGSPCPGGECVEYCEEETRSCLRADETTPCTDDDDPCTRDTCDGAGTCTHPTIPLAPVCRWVVVGGSDATTSSVRMRTNSDVVGGVCADSATILTTSDLGGHASWALLGDSGTVARVGADATIADGSFATGGGCIEGLHGSLIYDTSPGPICCADGDVELPGGNPNNVINACGTHELIGLCSESKAQIPYDVAFLEGLPRTQDLGGSLSIRRGASVVVAAGAALNVIDVDRIKINRGGAFVIDAQGNADAVVVIRIARGLKTNLRSAITLANGALPRNVVLYVADGNCTIGFGTHGAGTLFCPNGTVRLRVDAVWEGAVAGGTSVDVGWNVGLVHNPFVGFVAF